MRWKLLGLIVTAGLIAPVLATQASGRERRVDRECRREVVRLCGIQRSGIRACLQDRADALSEGCKMQFVQAIANRRGAGPGAPATDVQATTVPYGNDPRQAVDIYLPEQDRPTAGYPLIVYIHGGGWRNGNRSMVQGKPDFFMRKGWAFASAGYRLLPEVPVEQQAEDVAAALRKLVAESRALGIDPDRIVIMGHSAGAHLAALVATDPDYLKADMARIKGVILLDGAAYDVARQMQDQPLIAKQLYTPAFGTAPARQARLSPITHSAAPNAGQWLIMHVANRKDAAVQSNALGAALRAAGSRADVRSVEGENHMTINRNLGAEDNAHTRAVTAFLAAF
ncbi:alpha/beta hydrolase [Blastomonas sp.]|uniref:alpha/beta hydrolase n=1 Tax=Blastomonas sp. TaxID=1909299 RepID=UPI002629DBE0|nr:alpha/beta hydrolase [Blastomonas sp.]MDM7954906.1 alpha/beta hydrolase [Blastomonas sp.]